MSAIESFKFGQSYLLRPAGTNGHLVDDMILVQRWTLADPDHAGRVHPEFWIEQRLGRDSYLLEDAEGPLFFFKLHWWYRVPNEQALKPVGAEDMPQLVTLPWNGMERQVEIHIQFGPPMSNWDHDHRKSFAKLPGALIDGVQWLERALEPAGVRQLFFDSKSERLITFAVKRLGFEREQTVGASGEIRLVKALAQVQRSVA